MPSLTDINNLLEIQDSLINSLDNYCRVHPQLSNNDNIRKSYAQTKGKLDIIKNSIINIQEEDFVEHINQLQKYLDKLKELDNILIQTFNRDDNISRQEIMKAIDAVASIIISLQYHVNNLWEKIFKEIPDINTNYKRLREIAEDANRYYINELQSIVRRSEESANNVNQLKTKVETELQTLQEKYNNDITKYELISQTLTFDNSSKQNEKEAKNWRWIILIVTAILISACFYFICNSWFEFEDSVKYYYGLKNNTLLYYDLFRNATLRLFILSIIIYILKFSIKNYNAAKHNAMINLHKANSFNAALRIVTSLPESDNIRNVILKDAGKEIFTQQRTGYLIKESDNIDISLIDKILSMAKKE